METLLTSRGRTTTALSGVALPMLGTALLLGASLLVLGAGAAHSESYAYDPAGRLTHVVYDDGTTLSLAYDSRGNRLTRAASVPGADSDGDGLIDAVETGTGVFFSADDTGTDPLSADTDGDGAEDGHEVLLGFNPVNAASTPAAVATPALSLPALALLALLLVALAFAAFRSRARSSRPSRTSSRFGWWIALGAASGVLAPDPAAAICFLTGVIGEEYIACDPWTTSDNQNSATTGDPISTNGGELLEGPEVDLALGGPTGLAFVRKYASGLSGVLESDGVLGRGWLHNFEMSLDDTTGDIVIYFLWGRSLTFVPTGGGGCTEFCGDAEPDASGWGLESPQNPLYQLVEDGSDRVLLEPSSQRIYRFDSNGQLVSIADRNGNTLTLSYASGVLTTISDGLGRSLSLTYDANDKLATLSDGTRTLHYQVDGPGDATPGDLTQTTDTNGNITLYTTDGEGRIVSHTQPAGNTLYTQTYFGEGRVSAQTSARAATTALVYGFPDGSGTKETTVTDALGGTLLDTYDNDDNLTQRTDPLGAITALAYDDSDRRTSLTDAEFNVTSYVYDSESGFLTTLTHPEGARTTYHYAATIDTLGLVFYDVSSINHPAGTFETFALDASGNVTSHTGRGGAVTNFTHNARGQLLTVTNALGATTTFAYNPDATLASATTEAGDTTSYGYDSLLRPTSRTLPGGATRSFTYDKLDRVTGATDSLGGSNSTVYDANGRPTSVTDRLGNTATLTWDAMNQLSSTTDPLGNATSWSYDALERVASITNAAGETIQFGRDAVGRITSFTDPGGQVWSDSYDSVGVLQSSTSPEGRTTTFQIDPMGRRTRSISALGFETDFSFDPLGQLTAWTDPLDRTTIIEYGGGGRVTGTSLPGGIASTSYSYNALDQVTQLTDPGGNTWAFAYDNQGRPTGSTDPLGRQTTLSRTSRNRISGATFPDGLGGVIYDYDANGNLIQALYGGPTDLSFSYDALDRVTSAFGVTRSYDAAGRIAGGNGLIFSHDAVGRLASVNFAPGKTVAYAYDSRGNLASVTDWVGDGILASWHPDGDADAILHGNGIITWRDYDDDRRLTSIHHGELASVTLAYDAAGQLTSATRSGPQATATPSTGVATQAFDAASQLDGAAHDALGRQTQDAGRSYTWDLASRLTSITENGTTTQFEYDSLGRRTTRIEAGVFRNYIWNDALALPSVAIEIQDGTDLRYYVHAPDGTLLYSIEASDDSRRYYHFDETGNTTLLTNDVGDVIASYAYGPYGTVLAATPGIDNPFTWQGQMGVAQEGDGGLYYARARWYDSARSRFLSRDPLASLGARGSNPYLYAYANPLSYADPRGLFPGDPSYLWWGSVASMGGSSIFDHIEAKFGYLGRRARAIAEALEPAAKLYDEGRGARRARVHADRLAAVADSKLAVPFASVAVKASHLLDLTGGTFTGLGEFFNDTRNQTIAGQSFNALLVGGIDTLMGWHPGLGAATLVSVAVDGTVGHFFGDEYRPGLHEVFYNGGRAVAAVGEGLAGDWSSSWALAEEMSSGHHGRITAAFASDGEWWGDVFYDTFLKPTGDDDPYRR